MEKKDIDISEITRKFHQFEVQYIEEKDWELWDAIRYDVYYAIQDKILGVTNNSIPQISLKLNKFLFINEILSFTIKSLLNRRKIFFFTNSRFKNNESRNFDPNFYDVYLNYEKDSFIVESMCVNSAFQYPVVFNRYIEIINKLSNYIKLSTKLPQYIIRNLNSYFNINIDNRIAEQALNKYIWQKNYYKIYLNICRPKAIFVTQNCIQKSLFRAAKELNIPLTEFQHGLVYFSHLQYSYPINVNPQLLSLPTYFFAYSYFWKDKIKKYFPVKDIIVSGNTYAAYISSKTVIYDLTFICTTAYMDIFLKFIEELKSNGYNKKVCLKLHPQQFLEYDYLTNKFSNTQEIDVIYNEVSMKDVIGMSKNLLAIQSTSIYEALDAGKRVYILKTLSYRIHSDVFDNPLVHLIDNLAELLTSINNPNNSELISHTKYFEPFKKEEILKFINSRILSY